MLFLLLPLFFLVLSRLHLLEIVADQTLFLQNACSNFFTSRLSQGELASAFVCGTPIRDLHVHEIFIQTGLIHLMVVSGSHLQMLSLLLSWVTPKNWKSPWFDLGLALLLIFYALLSGFQPPVVRALAARLLMICSRFFHWSWDPGKINMAAGLLLLSLAPGWIFNFSFLLSWLASLGLIVAPLCFSTPCRPRRRALAMALSAVQFWLTCFCIQALMAVALLQFSVLGLFMNSLVAPLISILLFPLSLSVIVIPSLHGLIDIVWLSLLQFLQFFLVFATPTGISPYPSPDRWIYLWIFLAFIHAFFEFLQRFRYRGSSV